MSNSQEQLQKMLEERDAKIVDLDKKIRLGEFRMKKQQSELSLQLETQKIQHKETEEKLQIAKDLIQELKAKAAEQDKLILSLREEISQKPSTPEQSEEDEEQEEQEIVKLKFMPRQSMIMRAGNDLSQFPSYSELINLIQKQTGEHDEMKNFYTEATGLLTDLQNQNKELQQELTQSDNRLAELSKKKQRTSVNSIDMELKFKILQEEYDEELKKTDIEKNKLKQSIQDLYQQVDDLRLMNGDSSKNIEATLKEEYEQQRFKDEEEFIREKSLLLGEMQENEEKIRTYEVTFSEMDENIKKIIKKSNDDHNAQMELKNLELVQVTQKLEKDSKHHKESSAKQAQEQKQLNEHIIADNQLKLNELQLNLESLNKKVQRLEQEKERKDVWLEEYKVSNTKLLQELHIKNEKINNIVEQYEAQIQQEALNDRQKMKEYEAEIFLQIQQEFQQSQQKNNGNESLSSYLNGQRVSSFDSKEFERLNSMAKPLENQQQEIEELNKKLEAKKNKISELKENIQNMREKIIDNEKMVIKLNEELNNSKGYLQISIDQTKQLNETIQNMTEKQNESKQLVEDMNKQLSILQQVQQESEIMKEQIQTQINLIQDYCEKLNESIQTERKLNEQINALKTQINILNYSFNQIQDQKDSEYGLKIKNLEINIVTLKEELSKLQSIQIELITYQNSIEQQKESIIVRDEQIKSSKLTEQKLNEEITEFQSKLTTQQQLIQQQKESILSQQQLIEQQKESILSRDEQIKSSNLTKQKLNEDITEIQLKLQDYQLTSKKALPSTESQNESELKVKELQEELKSYEKQIHALNQSYSDSQKYPQNMDFMTKALQDQVKSQKEQITRLTMQQSINKLQAKTDPQQLLELQRQITKLNEREIVLQTDLENCNEERSSERAAHQIKQLEFQFQYGILQDEIELEKEERLYAEKIAANESIRRAQMSMDHEIQLQEMRKYLKTQIQK